jgi:hypothetical protein
MKKSLHPVGLAVVTLLIGVTTGGAHAQVAEPSALTSATRAAPFVQPSSATAANGIKLINLTAQGATVAAGDKACPSQPYYLYSGGKPDNFAGPADLAFPSPNLVAFIPANGPTVTYDTPMSDGRFGDSFNLQNTRGICYAVIEFKAKSTNGGSPNDGLTMGHVVGSNGSPFDVVAQIINPGAVTTVQSYAFDATGRGLLAQQTGWGLNKAPAQSVLDLYLQDDTMLDFFRMYIWYAPPCGGVGGASTC